MIVYMWRIDHIKEFCSFNAAQSLHYEQIVHERKLKFQG